MNSGHRRAAACLATLHRLDRRWLLARLPERERKRIVSLLRSPLMRRLAEGVPLDPAEFEVLPVAASSEVMTNRLDDSWSHWWNARQATLPPRLRQAVLAWQARGQGS